MKPEQQCEQWFTILIKFRKRLRHEVRSTPKIWKYRDYVMNIKRSRVHIVVRLEFM